MLNTLLSFINSLFVTEPTPWWSTWTMQTCDTCHKPLLAPDGTFQRFPDSQQIIGDLCESGHGTCKATLLSPYWYNHTNLISS